MRLSQSGQEALTHITGIGEHTTHNPQGNCIAMGLGEMAQEIRVPARPWPLDDDPVLDDPGAVEQVAGQVPQEGQVLCGFKRMTISRALEHLRLLAF